MTALETLRIVAKEIDDENCQPTAGALLALRLRGDWLEISGSIAAPSHLVKRPYCQGCLAYEQIEQGGLPVLRAAIRQVRDQLEGFGNAQTDV